MSIVWELDLPPGEKLVMLALADQANDEGVQCWPAVSTIAQRSGQGERTVRRALSDLETKGHLTRHHREGDSTQYHIHPGQSGTPAKSAPLPKTTKTPAKLAPKTPRNIKPKNGGARKDTRLPANWEPEPLSDGTTAYEIVAAWAPGRIERELSKFRDYWTAACGSRGLKRDWQAAWRTWIGNADEYGSRNQRTAPAQRPNDMDAAMRDLGFGR